jgi:hypothetical protein
MLTNDPPRSTHREILDVSPNRCGEMQQDPSCCDKQFPCTNLLLRLGPGDVDERYELTESHRELVTILRQRPDHTQAQQLYGLVHYRREMVVRHLVTPMRVDSRRRRDVWSQSM